MSTTLTSRIGRIWRVFTLLMVMLGSSLASASQKRILFYEPDANYHAIVQITQWFNLYLASSKLGYKFQPVQNANDFETQLRNDNVAFVIVASAYLAETQTQLTPLLVPANNEDVYYRKVLVAKTGTTAEGLTGKNIAAALGGTDRNAAISALKAQLKDAANPVNPGMVVPVAKDIDALFALTFGHVQGALVTPSSLDVLKKVNPNAAASVKAIYESDPILRAPLAAVSSRVNEDERKRFVQTLLSMYQDANGRKVMSSLAFNGWRQYEASMLKEGGQKP